MSIVPLLPALFANRLFADRTSHSRGSAPLLPILWTQFSSELLSVAHSTVFPRFHPKTHPHVGTLIRRHMCSTFVLHSYYFCFLLLWMRNTCGDSLQPKKTFVAIAWDERVLSHKVRSFVWFTIPLETGSVVHHRQCQIYLKVMTARMVIQILFPLFLSNVTFDKKTHHNIHCMDYPVPVQRPAENSQVVSICADFCRVVCTILIIERKTAFWLLNILWGMDLPLGIVPNPPIRINGIHWYGAHMTPIGRHEPIRARCHRILICGVLVHVTVTTGQRVRRVIIRTHHEREIVSSMLLGICLRSCESVQHCLRHTLTTSVGRGKSCERHFIVKSPIFFRSWRRDRVKA
jgi:hypothetical protein